MKLPAPQILRRGAVVRVHGGSDEPAEAAPAWAISFVDLRFEDGHVERWLGSACVRDEDSVPYAELVAWGTEVSAEHSLIGDLSMEFSGVRREALDTVGVEIFVEWNAELPDLS